MRKTVLMTLLIITLIVNSNTTIYADEVGERAITKSSVLTLNESLEFAIEKLTELMKISEITADEVAVEEVVEEVITTVKPVEYKSRTLELMENHDYYKESVTGISTHKVSEGILQQEQNDFGRLLYKGMPTEEYKAAMENKWIDVTEYGEQPEHIDIDLTNSIDYNTYVNILKRLSRYEGVFLYKIGKSEDDRDIYAIEIDIQSNTNKNVYMLAGQHHSREFAGGIFILKQFTDLIQKAQWDPETMQLLKNNKYVAVPIVSLDVREGMIQNRYAWTDNNGQLWKAYADGTDGNRNYPGLQWGLVAKGNSIVGGTAQSPSLAHYPGPYGGSSNETKAMMKWFYHYIVVEKAEYYLDYHQQGRVIYAGEPWQYQRQFDIQMKFIDNLQSVLKTSGGLSYHYVRESEQYGLRGEGSASTDYAISLAVGAKFSPAYGFHVFPHWGREVTLMEIRDLDRQMITPKETNPNFAAVTLEIGSGQSYLGYSEHTRRLLNEEYYNYNFGQLLEKLPTFVK